MIDEEERQMTMSEKSKNVQLSSEEIKKRLFVLLCVFADFCDKNNLRYYLCGGTLLGAIRHKGFIPWDDDIDVMMPRPDYDELHQLIGQRLINNQYKLISYTNGNSFWPYAKIIDPSTHIESKYSRVNKWLWMDIFPMDGLPDDIKKSSRHLKKITRIKKWYTRSEAVIGEGKTKFRAAMKLPMVSLMKMVNLKKISRYIDKEARKYDFDQSDFVGGVTWSLGPCERMKKNDYINMTEAEFCGRMFHIPGNWEYYLTSLYGDYMMLPPKEKRVTHHDMVVFVHE